MASKFSYRTGRRGWNRPSVRKRWSATSKCDKHSSTSSAVVAWVPNGKGMAGLALERKEPIQTCNLKDDSSGNVRPGAKAVNAQAAVALPVSDGATGVRAVVGIAFPDEREFTKAELDDLTAAASTVPNA